MKGWLHSIIIFLCSGIKRKMILMVLVTLFLVVGISGIVIYKVSINLQMNDAKANDALKVQFINENLDETISSISSMIDSITEDSEIQAVLNQPASHSEDLVERLDKMLLSKTSYASDIFRSLYLFDNYKLVTEINYKNLENIKKSDVELKKYRYDTVERISWRSENDIIYIDKAIRQRESLKLLGYITISLDQDYLKQRLQSEKYRYTYVFDENGKVIVSDNKSLEINSEELLLWAKQETNGVPDLLKVPSYGDMLLTTNISESGKWRVVSLIPVKEIAKGPDLIGWWIFVIGCIGIIIGIIMTWVSTNRLIAPLYDLKQVMDQVETDNFQHTVHIRSHDEFARLGRSFNQMMEKINYLISEVYQKELAQKKLEYKVLKAQINPHFLYNTLDTIRWLALYEETEKIERVAISLAQLLKTSLKESKEMVPIKTEFEYIDAYLYIQKTRFEKINVSINVDDHITNLYIPRFTLQPLVENAFIHGLEKKIGSGNLIISGTLSVQGIKIRIIDNGAGIEEEKLTTLLAEDGAVNQNLERGTGTGLKNVHKRIQTLYGEEYGLSIQSSLNTGTIVEVLLPAFEENRATLKSI